MKNLDLSYKNIPEGIVHPSFTDCTTFGKLNEDKYNLFTTNIEITFKNKPAENTFVLFAVKTTSGIYYLGYCKNGNSEKGNGLFSGSKLNQEIKMLYTGDGLTNIGSMFSQNIKLGNIVFTNCFDTNKVTDMSYMFFKCSSLTNLNISNLKTNNVTDISGMFSGCLALNELNLSNFKTNNVTNMRSMFYSCSSLKELNVSNFNTNNVTNMSSMFYGCSSLKKLNLSNFHTNNVTNISYMFNDCSSLKELKLSNFNTNNVTNMSCMFSRCSSLKELNLSNFNTNNVKSF